jgi:antitoxin HigA-1
MAKSRRLPPVHPGEILKEDLLTPLGLSINGLARELRAPVTRMSGIVNGRRSITADTALRLARYFGSTPQFWMNLQASYDLDVATRMSADKIERDVHPREAAQACWPVATRADGPSLDACIRRHPEYRGDSDGCRVEDSPRHARMCGTSRGPHAARGTCERS